MKVLILIVYHVLLQFLGLVYKIVHVYLIIMKQEVNKMDVRYVIINVETAKLNQQLV